MAKQKRQTFAVGDVVRWTGFGYGRPGDHKGTVVYVMQPGEYPQNVIRALREKYEADGLPVVSMVEGAIYRMHESYIVEEKKGKSVPKLMWPVVSRLRKGDQQ